MFIQSSANSSSPWLTWRTCCCIYIGKPCTRLISFTPQVLICTVTRHDSSMIQRIFADNTSLWASIVPSFMEMNQNINLPLSILQVKTATAWSLVLWKQIVENGSKRSHALVPKDQAFGRPASPGSKEISSTLRISEGWPSKWKGEYTCITQGVFWSSKIAQFWGVRDTLG